jgi:hypothetical protein
MGSRPRRCFKRQVQPALFSFEHGCTAGLVWGGVLALHFGGKVCCESRALRWAGSLVTVACEQVGML